MSKRIEELLEEYSSNRKQYIGEKHFKFLRKVFKAFKEVGALNISFIYYTLNSNSPKIMDSEFMKAYIESMLKDNHTLLSIFTGYWENNRGLELTEGLNTNFNMILKEEEVFAALIANNELEKVLQLLSITYYRIKSLTETTSEDLFYSKCLSDYEREDFKSAVAGLQFFGFSKKEKEEKARKKLENELYSEMEIEYVKDKTNGLYKDLTDLEDKIKKSLKSNKKLITDRDINKCFDFTPAFEDGTEISFSKITKDYIEDKYKNGIEDIRLITWDISEGGFDAVENYDSNSGQEMWDLQIDVEEEINYAIGDVLEEINLSVGFDSSMSSSSYTAKIKDLFMLNNKYKKLFDKRVKEELSATSGLQSFGFSLAESKADNIRRESLKKMREEGKAYNQKLKDEGKGFFERIKLNYKFDQEQIDKIQKEYYKNIEKFSKAEDKDNKIAPLSKEEIENYLALNKEAFNAIKEAYKKFSKIEEFAPVEKQAPDDEWGSWDSFVDGKTSFYSIALVSWDQEDWLDNGRTLVKEANNILSKKGIGEKILTIGGDGDEGIIDVDIRGAEINFDKLK